MNLSYLDVLENRSIYIIREAYQKYRQRLAILWSMGKDSTTLVHLARKAFLGHMPIQVIHIDTGYKFKEIYEFRRQYAREWALPLVIARNESALRQKISPKDDRFICCTQLKTEALKEVVREKHLQALLVAIRRDEHAIRAKERYFSKRNESFQWDYKNQPPELWDQYSSCAMEAGTHTRVHPLLHWREIDVWRYVQKERLPVVSLYFSKNQQRYRSIGCACCCQPIPSSADTINKIIQEIEATHDAERAGRAQDKEKDYMMQKLRSLGYM